MKVLPFTGYAMPMLSCGISTRRASSGIVDLVNEYNRRANDGCIITTREETAKWNEERRVDHGWRIIELIEDSNKMHSVSGHQSSGRRSTFSNTSVFERNLGEGGNNDSCGIGRDVMTLRKEGWLEEALHFLNLLDQRDMRAHFDTYVTLLQKCVNMKALAEGKQVHAHIIKNRFQPHIFLGNMLVNMYTKCGSVVDARQVFDKMPKRDASTWTMVIAGYAKHGCPDEALKLFWQMESEGVKADMVTFVSILKACTNLQVLERIHSHIIRCGFKSDVFVGSTLVDMYAKCGSIEHARQVFIRMPKRNVVSWTAMITGYAQHGHGEEALKFFWQMQLEGVKPNGVTFASTLKACASLGSVEQGKKIHALITKSGLKLDVFVGSSLVDMYAKCGNIEHALQVFNVMPIRNVVSWTTMISGYVQHGHGKAALKLFWQMEKEGVKPNEVTFVNALNACAILTTLEQGKRIHTYLNKSGFESNVFVGSTLVDMYAKCGSIEYAWQVFAKMPKRDIVSWTAMISGYAQHGHGKEALHLAIQMQHEGMKPDRVTFLSVLAACSHAGLIDEAKHYFDDMHQVHGFTPASEHYACMVDLLGRAGHLEEAEELIKKMPFQPTAVMWRALLGACRTHGNLELAKYAAECILELEPQNTAAFVLLSNIYAASGRWDDKVKVI